jgi:hypothetical protein
MIRKNKCSCSDIRPKYALLKATAIGDPKVFDELLHLVRTFTEFNEDNDPHHEHDLGCIALKGITYMWKFDYYAGDWEQGADPTEGQTNLLLTIMRAEEY